MARPRSRKRAPVRIDEAELAAFRAGMRRRYTDEEILDELRAAAERLGRSPTMREFAQDPEARVHPQTVIEHFGTWNAAKRAAGLFPRRFLTRDELLEQLRGARRRAREDADGARTSPRAAARSRPRRSTRTRSARSATRSARPGSRCSRARSVSSGRSRRALRSRGHSVACPKMADWADAPTSRSRRSCPSGRCTGCSTSRAAPGRRSSTSCASASREGVDVRRRIARRG